VEFCVRFDPRMSDRKIKANSRLFRQSLPDGLPLLPRVPGIIGGRADRG
jgi:hypothetical protein